MARPIFHFTVRNGWINDPHGITFRDGGYDAFFQYVPGQTVWGPNCHWGHARGVDLLSLVEREPAIYPGDGDDGIWTGSLMQLPDGPRIFYTSVAGENMAVGRVRVATPLSDDWDAWEKGPVVITAPEGEAFVGFRDPFVRRDTDAWRAFLGAGDTDGNALALSYASHDLATWEYEGVALARPSSEREPVWAGGMWECPQIFEIDDRFVMLSSAWDRDVLHYACYAIGSYASGRFHAESWGRLTYGESYYAPSFFRDDKGRPAMTLWMRGVEDAEAGWASAHSIPYLLSLDGDVLVGTPHPDIVRYRARSTLQRTPGQAADIEWEGDGSLLVEDDAGNLIMSLSASLNELDVRAETGQWSLPFRSPATRIVIDEGVVEISTDLGLLGFSVALAGPGTRVVGNGAVLYALSRDV